MQNQTTQRKQRQAFERELFLSMRPALKAMGWKKKENFLFCESDGYYQDATILVDLQAPATHVDWTFKPMAIDPIYWAISEEEECARQPLSFRSVGLSTCPGL